MSYIHSSLNVLAWSKCYCELVWLCGFYYGVSAPDSASSIWDFFETGDHTDWETAPSSYDLQSWGSLGLNDHLRIIYPHEPP